MLSIVPYEPTATDWSRTRRQVNCYQADRPPEPGTSQHAPQSACNTGLYHSQ